jgi:AcrR family transcriptional regulator
VPPVPSRRRLDRKTVIKAAAELMDEDPSRELTLADLARHLSVRTPSLYNHVDSLDDLRQGIAVYGAHQLADWLGQAAIGRSDTKALTSIAWAYRKFATEHPGLHQATQRAPEPGQTELAEAAERILAILRRVLEPMGLSETEQIHAIRALRAMVHGFVSLEQAGGFGMPVDLDESFQYLVEIYLARISSADVAEVR